MTAPTSPTPSSSAVADTGLSPAEIDASCRWPLLLLFVSGVFWLLVGLMFALISSIKLHAPGFLADCPILTLGRVRPAAMNALLYGFAGQIGMGVMLWLLCRLGTVRLAFQVPLLIAGKVWNLGVLVGVWAILAGASTGFEWLEMPRYAAPFLFIGYFVMGLGAVATFTLRRQQTLYVSHWYLLMAVFWFPWIFSAANLLLIFSPVRGVYQSVVNAWYTGNLLGLWLGSIALAAIFYFLPKLTHRPLYSQQLAVFAFWTTALFGNWAGPASLIGAPVPRWIGAVGTVGAVGLLLPLVANAMNWQLTCAGSRDAFKKSIELRFVLFGAVAYLIGGVATAVMARPEVSAVTNLTYATVGRNYLLILGFVGMVLFGALYYIVPRLIQANWACEVLPKVHFLGSSIGIAIVFLALTLGGINQGWKLADPTVPFVTIVKGTIPFVGMSTLGLFLVLAGQCAFALNLGISLRTFCEPFCRRFCSEFCACGPAASEGVKS
jgi:cytochrome c oxidase cbb3-type subunit 1